MLFLLTFGKCYLSHIKGKCVLLRVPHSLILRLSGRQAKPSFSTIYTSPAPCQATRNVIQSYRVEKTAIVSVLADLCVKHRRVASDDWYSLDVALFHFLSCTYLRCASSITTINVCVSSSYSAMNCFALVRKSILLVLERCFIKSLAPIRIQSFFTRGAKS